MKLKRFFVFEFYYLCVLIHFAFSFDPVFFYLLLYCNSVKKDKMTAHFLAIMFNMFVFFRLKDTAWVKDMLNTLGDKLTTTVISFAHTATKLSSNKKDIESWVQVFQEQFEENCEDLLNDIKHLEAETLNKVEKSLKRIQELCKMLQVEMPDLGNEKLSLYQEQHILKKHIAE